MTHLMTDQLSVKMVRRITMNVETTVNEVSEAAWGEAIKGGLVGLGDVPVAHRTYGVCREALWRADSEIEFVPHDIYEWIGSWGLRMLLDREGGLLKFIPEKLREYGLCDTAVARDGLALEFVPERHKCFGLCMMAVRRDPLALAFVPETLKEGWLCLVAVKATPGAFEHIPEHLKTLEVCHWASREGTLPMGVPLRYKKLLERILSAPGRLRPGSLPPERLPR